MILELIPGASFKKISGAGGGGGRSGLTLQSAKNRGPSAKKNSLYATTQHPACFILNLHNTEEYIWSDKTANHI